jgi:hypothetical protein
MRWAVLLLPLVLTVACTDDEPDPQAFCRLLREAAPLEQALADAAGGQDPAAGRRRLDDLLARLEEASGAAPGEVDDDVEAVVEAVRAYRDALAETDPDDPAAVREALAEVEVDDEEVEAASARLARYRRDECGESFVTSTTTTVPPTQAPHG